MSKIYIAASFMRKPAAIRLRKYLRQAGHEVTSRWLDLSYKSEDYMQMDAVMEGAAAMDFQDVMRADTVIVIAGDAPDEQSKGGKHTELGIALGTGKRMILWGDREQLFHWHPAVRVAKDERELMQLLL